MSTLRIKRIYDPAVPTDGFRVLVDRLWPRGVSKTRAALDLWLKEIAPSAELREWFDHEPARFDEFAEKYRAELMNNVEPVKQLCGIVKSRNTTLLYGAHDRHINQAVVLGKFLAKHGVRFKTNG
ncbi:DUF488 domain-containing protein [Sphingobium vermicomposti]|uniref:Uncharacterized protein YeaO (DUF488 family) n=1 Tax=Sphingobium vermicomposti TaxID=529005 RepID=A0A846MGU5_9SPHN|nr:DUF488 domain-containing protein [Sphingobium vermicomposti]NIJ16326.1 uncharacterized protein YeaO (DUF488 family) [Sphingobium vermicomposti]